jgi:hypothetical protein
MILSHRSATTIVCDFCDSEYQIKTPDEFSMLMKKSIELKEQHGSIMRPSDDLLAIINKVPADSIFSKKLSVGFGDLFRIVVKNKNDGKNIPPQFSWRSVKIDNAPVGTHYSLKGGIIHAGAGARNDGDIRILLFWTFHLKDDLPYDTDYQETKLTLIVSLAKDIWDMLDSEKHKVDMLKIIWHVFETCQSSYKKTCYSTFTAYYTHMPDIMKRFAKFPQRNTDKRRKEIIQYLQSLVKKHPNLFE